MCLQRIRMELCILTEFGMINRKMKLNCLFEFKEKRNKKKRDIVENLYFIGALGNTVIACVNSPECVINSFPISALPKKSILYLGPGATSAYEPSGSSGRSLSRFLSHEKPRSISTPLWM